MSECPGRRVLVGGPRESALREVSADAPHGRAVRERDGRTTLYFATDGVPDAVSDAAATRTAREALRLWTDTGAEPETALEALGGTGREPAWTELEAAATAWRVEEALHREGWEAAPALGAVREALAAGDTEGARARTEAAETARTERAAAHAWAAADTARALAAEGERTAADAAQGLGGEDALLRAAAPLVLAGDGDALRAARALLWGPEPAESPAEAGERVNTAHARDEPDTTALLDAAMRCTRERATWTRTKDTAAQRWMARAAEAADTRDARGGDDAAIEALARIARDARPQGPCTLSPGGTLIWGAGRGRRTYAQALCGNTHAGAAHSTVHARGRDTHTHVLAGADAALIARASAARHPAAAPDSVLVRVREALLVAEGYARTAQEERSVRATVHALHLGAGVATRAPQWERRLTAALDAARAGAPHAVDAGALTEARATLGGTAPGETPTEQTRRWMTQRALTQALAASGRATAMREKRAAMRGRTTDSPSR